MLLILLILIITDLFFFKGIRHLLKLKLTKKQKKILSLLFWAHSIGFLVGTLLVSRWMHNDYDPAVQRKIFCFVGLFLAFYIPKLLFIPFSFFPFFSNDSSKTGRNLIFILKMYNVKSVYSIF